MFDASTAGELTSRLREKTADQLCERNIENRGVLDEVSKGTGDALLAPAGSVQSSTVAPGVLGNCILDLILFLVGLLHGEDVVLGSISM